MRDLLARLAHRLELLLCRTQFGHMDEPVAINRREWAVLLRCVRCGRDATLLGEEARAWTERWVATL
jgi:hypothetical protein